jgi:peptide/nickel transport system substrate-binding protein
MLSRKVRISGLVLVGLSLLLSACQSLAQPSPVTNTASPAPTVVLPTPTPTLPPERSLVICLGQEPQSLYVYAGSSRSMWSVLEAIYDGPIDNRQYSAQPVILQKLPSLKDGDAKLQPVTVRAGNEVVAADGNLTTLTKGVKVLPVGCTGPDCAATYDGTSDIQLDQMVVTFKLLKGLKWSDGAPLTAADSVFSYQISANQDTPVSKRMTDRTAEYKALDEGSVQWTGKPGFVYNRYFTNFWLPLPEHTWKGKSAADILKSADAAQKPLGWGPYMLKEWTQGDHITLQKNPSYFRAAEGLPKFDNLVYRFLGEQGDNALTALQNGECDIVDQTTLLDSQLEKVLDLQKNGKLKAYVGQGPEWEHIEFGIKPAEYDDAANTAAKSRPNFFSDVRVRQAFAYCMDRKAAVDKQLLGQAPIPNGYLPPDHPLYAPDLQAYSYDVQKGSSLLDEVGWKDDDNNPATPRKAVGVPNVPDETPLEVQYLTTQAALRVEVSKSLTESMAACGIKLDVQSLSPDEMYAAGPEGPLFGRKFDLAQFSWQADTQSPCFLYESSQIPNASNHWVRANISGFSNPDFDAACKSAQQLLPDQPGYKEKNMDVQRIYAQQLPSIPLYFQLKLAVSKPDVCGLEMDVTDRSILWNIEAIDMGTTCKK